MTEKDTRSDEKWRNVIFSDEKKFNLDGPDGCQSYWYQMRKDEQIFSKRPFGGGSLMIWGAFSSNERDKLIEMKSKQNATKYAEILENSLPSFI